MPNPKTHTQNVLRKTSEEGRDLTGVPEMFYFCGCSVGLEMYARGPDGGRNTNQHLPVGKVSPTPTQFLFFVPLRSCWERVDLCWAVDEQTGPARGTPLVIYAPTVISRYSCRMRVVQGYRARGRDGGHGCSTGTMPRHLLRGWRVPEQSLLQLRKSSCSLQPLTGSWAQPAKK